MASEFDSADRIAGFPLVKIQRALVWVGVMDDRDDVKGVCDALGCGPRQATDVLDELVERGFIAKTTKRRNQWTKTEKGYRLAHDWKAPRRLRPMIERDDMNSPTNEGTGEVPCLLYGSQDDEHSVEEAWLHITFWAEYEGNHLVELSEFQPSDYDDPDAGGMSSRCAYLTPKDARALAAGLQKAADKAEAEIKRRAKHPPKRSRVPRESRATTDGAREDGKASAEEEAKLKAKELARTNAAARKKEREALVATVAELRSAKVGRPSPTKKP